MSNTGKKPLVDPDFTLRRVFGKSNFRYPLSFPYPEFLLFFDNPSDHISVRLLQRHLKGMMCLFRLVRTLYRDRDKYAPISLSSNSYFIWVNTFSAGSRKCPPDVVYRKSLCFQLPAMIDHGITIVVSPLLALMNNQVAALRTAGIPVATINSSTPTEERRDILKDLCSGV